MKRACVLLSGGIDSATCLYIAVDAVGLGRVMAVSIDYGQRHSRELNHAVDLCHGLGVRHDFIELDKVVPRTMLTDAESKVPNVSYDQIQGVSPAYVPFRNGLMLSAMASYAQQPEWKDDQIDLYFGAHAEDAHNWAYPDCTPEFIGAMANAIYVGTSGRLRLITPLQWMVKREIITLGTELGVPYRMTWSCYKGGIKHCGTCPTCRARQHGFRAAHVLDPTEYSMEAA